MVRSIRKPPAGGTSTSGAGSSSGSGSNDPGKYGLGVSGSFAVIGYDSPRDPNDKAGIGDVVKIMETRPLSRLKRWRLVEIIEKAK